MLKKIVLLMFVGSLIYSCGSKKSVARKRHKKSNTEQVIIGKAPNRELSNSIDPKPITPVKISSTEQYLAMYSEIAKNEMRLYGIPASITLAQGILESNSGRGRLSVEANNHFGIKCHDWTGARVYHDDDRAHECFRKYKDAKYSYRDHSLFLSTRKRYAKLFELDKDDYKHWAKELKAAGYATDRKYPEKLISLIERYKLYDLDDEVLNPKKHQRILEDTTSVLAIADPSDKVKPVNDSISNPVEKEENVEVKVVNVSTDSVPEIRQPDPAKPIKPMATYTVGQGDTLYSIAKKNNVTVAELQEMNGLEGTAISIGQELIIQDPPATTTYTVKPGDTLYSISKKYNTTVKLLQQLNGLEDDTISIGQQLLIN